MASSDPVVERLNPQKPFPIITHGARYYEACTYHLETSLQRSRPFLIVSGSLSRSTNTIQELKDSLGSENIAGIRQGMQPHTLYSEVLLIAEEVQKSQADSIIVVGGGSLVDGAKAIVLAIANDADTPEKLDHLFKTSSDLRRKQQLTMDNPEVTPSTIPFMCVTTTLSAGEFNPFGGATNDVTKHKQLFADPRSEGPRVIAMDPQLVLTAPMRVWLSTGLRAVDHCVETICSSKPDPEGTKHSVKGLKMLIPALLRTKDDPNDLDARLEAQLGAAESMKAFLLYGVPPGGSHGIGHQIGPYGVPHAETTCIALPAVQKFNKRINSEQQSIALAALWDDASIGSILRKYSLSPEAADLSDALDAIIRELGFPRTLKEYGIGKDKLDVIAESSLHDALCRLNVIPLVKKEQVLEILQMCYGE